MNKLKRRLAIVSTFIFLATSYCMLDPHYQKDSYEITEEGPFTAKCSCGTIYIGDYEVLKDIPREDGVILVEDQRDGKDPNMKIYNSCFIDSRCDRDEVLQVLLEYEKKYPSRWNRTIESMRLEWLFHNLSYQFRYKEDHAADVDLNNQDEEKYQSKILQNIFRLNG